MALCREPIALASCSGRTDAAFLPIRHRKTPTACRFIPTTNFIQCRVAKTQASGFRQDEDYPQFQRFHATCERGLEEILAAELSSPLIAASQVELSSGGVSFVGTQATGYNANLWLRTGDRVLCELARGSLPKGGGVCEFVRDAVDWQSLLVDDDGHDDSTFRVQTRFSHSSIKDQSSVSTTIRDVIRDACGPGLRGELHLHVDREEAVVYRDMSGVSLEVRGYGDRVVKSKEGFAAAVLTIAGWNHMVPGFGDANRNDLLEERVLLDPFCGTGSILIQAALMACNVAPGLMRPRWPFQAWHDYDERAWTECRESAVAMQVSSLSGGARLVGNDMRDGAIVKCKRAASAAGVLHLLHLSCEPSRHYRPAFTPSLVVTNPPSSAPLTYSSLRGEDERLLTQWHGFGQFLKSQCRGADVYVVSENDLLTRSLRLVPDRKWDMQPDKHWRGRAAGSKSDKIFGSQERKLLHFHIQPVARRPQGDPISALPFSPLSSKLSK